MWGDGAWPLALVILIASVVIPLAKLLVLAALLLSVHRRWRGARLQRARLYRLIDRIGRWSMTDIFVVAIVSTLVQLRGVATIRVGPAAVAFGAVVVLTMMATRAFDPRLIWDPELQGRSRRMRDDPELPEAVVMPRSRFRPEFIWAIPIVAVLIGGWLAVRAIRARGPIITISFNNAGGAGRRQDEDQIPRRRCRRGAQHRRRPRSRHGGDHRRAEARGRARGWWRTRSFWVVRARVAAAEVSGLETLLSGAYIGVDVGTSKRARRHFKGLEQVPVVSGGTQGRMFVAHAPRAIGAGSPIYFRHLEVGQVTTSDLEPDGRQVSIGMFVRRRSIASSRRAPDSGRRAGFAPRWMRPPSRSRSSRW